MAGVEPGARILITGGCGFVGSNLVARLATEGFAVRVIDNLSQGRPESIDHTDAELIVADVGNLSTLAAVVTDCEAIVHLAAATSVQDSIGQPLETLDANTRATVVLLGTARQAGVRQFVFASSNAAVGEHTGALYEGVLPAPVSPYGASKLAGEAFCASFTRSYGLATSSLRFSNVYGPGSQAKGSVVAKMIRSILAGDDVTIYGDGRQTRDFIHVQDVVSAIVLCLRCEGAGGLFQVGTGIETSILDLVAVLEEVAGRRIVRHHAPPRVGDIARNYASIERARLVLGFEPSLDLPSGLTDTYSWFCALDQRSRL